MMHTGIHVISDATNQVQQDEKVQYVVLRGENAESEEPTSSTVPEMLPENGAVNDLCHYCRICACSYDAMIPIYDENGVELQLEEKINNYLPITVSTEDQLPLNVCQICVDKLNVTHDLIVSCLDSNSRYIQYLEAQQNTKVEIDEKPNISQLVVENPGTTVNDAGEISETPKVKKKVVVLKLVHSNSSDLSPSVRIAKALEYLKKKNKQVNETTNPHSTITVKTENNNCNSSIKISPVEKSTEKANSDLDKLQVASVAEFCVVTSGKEGSGGLNSESPRLESKISKALGKVDNGTKRRIVKAVKNIVSKRKDTKCHFTPCLNCGMNFHSHGEVVNHNCTKRKLKSPRSGDYQCNMCKKTFKKLYKLKIHKQIHKRENDFTCPKCEKKFTRKDSLHIHQILHQDTKPYSCKHCQKRFLHRSSLVIHRKSEHSEIKPWLCDACGKAFAFMNLLHRHHCNGSSKTNHKVGKCLHCNKVFQSKLLLKEHVKTHAAEKNSKSFQCTQCPKVFSSQERLKQHEPIHMGVRPYQCGICSIGFIRKGNLTKHYKTHSAEKIITCRVCKATFPSVGGLLNHRKSHTTEEWDQIKKEDTLEVVQKTAIAPDNYQCSICNKFLSSKLSLSLHMRVHTGEKPYQCEICNKRFTQKPALTYHKRLHTGERPHTCQYCGKGFNSKVGKESHERIHTGERPYKCGQCGVGFRCSANLRQHTWIHTDNRPFVCEVCRKLFRRREALQVHMRIHTGERPYSCPICSRSFTQKGDMLKHTRSHSKKNVRFTGMACPYCSQVFSRKMHFKMHVEKCSLSKEHVELVRREDTSGQTEQFVNLVTEGGEALKSVTIASEEMIPKFSEITIVSNDIQEYEVEYQS